MKASIYLLQIYGQITWYFLRRKAICEILMPGEDPSKVSQEYL